MATVDSIVNYVMNSPYNTNPGVLRSQLNELEGGGGGDLPREVTSAIENDGLGYMTETPAPITYDGDISGQDVYPYGEYMFVKRVGDYIPLEAAISAGLKAHWGGLQISQTYSTEDVQALYTQDEQNILFINVLRNTTYDEQSLVKGLYVFDGPDYFGVAGSDVDNIIINGTKITYTVDETVYYDGNYVKYYLTSADISEILDTDEVAVDVNYTGTVGLTRSNFEGYASQSPVRSTTGTVIGWRDSYNDIPQIFSIYQGDGDYNLPVGTYLMCIPAIDTYISEVDLVAQPHLIDAKFIPNANFIVTLSNGIPDTGRVTLWGADKTYAEIREAINAGCMLYISIDGYPYIAPMKFNDGGTCGLGFMPNGDKLEAWYCHTYLDSDTEVWETLSYTWTPDSL